MSKAYTHKAPNGYWYGKVQTPKGIWIGINGDAQTKYEAELFLRQLGYEIVQEHDARARINVARTKL